jgi:antitoxin component of RelBE/YafQ-DinJ toxin-antitoxin module
MNNVSISIKTEPELKIKAQKIADNIGVSIADLINGYLKQLVKSQSGLITQTEYPTPYLLETIKLAKKERKEGKASPIFDNPEDAIKWLNS